MEIKKIKMNPMNSAAHIKEESVVSSSFLKLGSQRTGRKRTATMAVSSFLRYNLTPISTCAPLPMQHVWMVQVQLKFTLHLIIS